MVLGTAASEPREGRVSLDTRDSFLVEGVSKTRERLFLEQEGGREV